MKAKNHDIEVLPCPFCGCETVSIISNGIGDFFTICGDPDEVEEDPGCGVRTSDVRCESPEMAAERWNQRAGSKSPRRDTVVLQYITYEWLRGHGFKIDHCHNDSDVHMTRCYDRGNDHHVEIAESRDGSWFCWLRDDLSHSKCRFIHVRDLRTTQDLDRLWIGITGQPLTEEDFDLDRFLDVLQREKNEALLRYLDYAHGERYAHR